MVIIAAALAAAALAQEPEQLSATVVQRQAQATVTIVSSSALRFAEIERDQPNSLRETVVRGPGGSTETVKLVEFQ